MNNSNKRPIIIAEDNDDDFSLIQETLLKHNVMNPMRRVANGEACLDLLRGVDEAPVRPLLLLLDLNLPGIDGRDVLEEIKTDAKLSMIPVIVLTTSSNPYDIEICYRFGANSYHLKPLDVPEFRHVVTGIVDYWLGLSILPTEGNDVQWPNKH